MSINWPSLTANSLIQCNCTHTFITFIIVYRVKVPACNIKNSWIKKFLPYKIWNIANCGFNRFNLDFYFYFIVFVFFILRKEAIINDHFFFEFLLNRKNFLRRKKNTSFRLSYTNIYTRYTKILSPRTLYFVFMFVLISKKKKYCFVHTVRFI